MGSVWGARQRSLTLHFPQTMEGQTANVKCLPLPVGNCKKPGREGVFEKGPYLGEHPIKLPGLLAIPFCRVGTSVTKSCYLNRQGWVTFIGACDENQAKW